MTFAPTRQADPEMPPRPTGRVGCYHRCPPADPNAQQLHGCSGTKADTPEGGSLTKGERR